jgi:hypothetical protein
MQACFRVHQKAANPVESVHVPQTQQPLVEWTSQSFETIPDSVSHLQDHCLDHLNWILIIEKEVRTPVMQAFLNKA